MKAGALVLIGAVALGAAVRLIGGVPLLQTELALPVPARALADAPAAGGPEQVVAAFYASLQRGEYDKAWEVSLEPDWAAARTASYAEEVAPSPRVTGWTTEKDFVRRCADDIGAGLKLNAIEVTRLPSPPETPEARAVTGLGATRAFGVRASGHMLGACLIYHWERDLVVAEVGGSYKVVLPGTKAAHAAFHQDWLTNLSLIGSLRASGK